MFYGGLLLYDTPLGSDPATVFAPAGAGVVGTAMAGQVNATKNTVRQRHPDRDEDRPVERRRDLRL